jgi:hypothetical protein
MELTGLSAGTPTAKGIGRDEYALWLDNRGMWLTGFRMPGEAGACRSMLPGSYPGADAWALWRSSSKI